MLLAQGIHLMRVSLKDGSERRESSKSHDKKNVARLSLSEKRFLAKNYIARLATCSRSSIPHVSPTYFAFSERSIFFLTNITSRKYADVSDNRVASAVVDTFERVPASKERKIVTREKAVVISGSATIRTKGKHFDEMIRKLKAKYPDYRQGGRWQPTNQDVIVEIEINRISSWGLGGQANSMRHRQPESLFPER